MPTFVLMTKLGPDAKTDPRMRREEGRAWKKRVEEHCPGIRWVAHYALLGPYDVMDVYEVPDERSAMKVSLLSRAMGAVSAESWPAEGYEHFLELCDELGSSKKK